MKLIGRTNQIKTPEDIKFEEEIDKLTTKAKIKGLIWGAVIVNIVWILSTIIILNVK